MQYNKQHRKNVELSFVTVSAESEVATCCFRIRPCRRVRLAELLECRVHVHCCQLSFPIIRNDNDYEISRVLCSLRVSLSLQVSQFTAQHLQ